MPVRLFSAAGPCPVLATWHQALYETAMHTYRIVNVFTMDGDRFSGNPLCVFEDARGLSDVQMQALARQMNLSETTFVLPSERGDARVRIFTPEFEVPFAGHPTLGTASVVAAGRDRVVLDVTAGLVQVTHSAGAWTLRAFADTPESGTQPEKISDTTRDVGPADTLGLALAPAGGYAAVLSLRP